MSDHTKGRLEAVIWRHAGQPDTVCLKDEQGNELVNWMGFDGNVYTKAMTRANAKRLAAGWNALDEAAETILALRAAINDVLTHRRGELPTLGYIRDNDESRAAIARLAALTTEPAP